MNETLKTICDTVIKNIQTASAFYKIEYKSSFAVYGITNADRGIIANDIAEADKYFASQKGIGGVFGMSDNVRRMLASSCVIKALGEDKAPFSECEYLTVMSCQNQIKSEQDSSAATTVPVI